MAGPLEGLTVIEFAGIGPGPYACMLLADMGADVIRIDRPNDLMSTSSNPADILNRNRRSIIADLKSPEAAEVIFKLIESADVVVEGLRPGVMEKLGYGPEECMARNPKLIYGRMTGWGQEGPLSQRAGHDLNYIAITGALAAMGRREGGPVPPLNLLGDFAGGSMFLVMGILSALYESNKSGKGQVVDAAICDGVLSLMASTQNFFDSGMWDDNQRQSNMLDGGAHYYDTYECSDGEWITLGAVEQQFYVEMLEKLGLSDTALAEQDFLTRMSRGGWEEGKVIIAETVKTKTRNEWCEIFEGSDACFAPVLKMSEVPDYPHNKERNAFVQIGEYRQCAPAPRLSRTPGEVRSLSVGPGTNTRELLGEAGYSAEEIESILQGGAIRETNS